MMKRNRLIYLVIFFLSLTFVYFYGGRVPYAIFYSVIALPVLSLAYTCLIYVRFKYVQTVDKKYVSKGDTVHFSFSISNEDIYLYPYIKITFCGSDTLFKDQFVQRYLSLAPFSKKSFDFSLACKYRGCYEIGIKTIEIEDFLGILSLKYSINETKDIIVSPKVVPLDKFALKTDFFSETHSVLNNSNEDMSTVSDIRKYQYGDSLKKIHWKLTAKTAEIKVKEFQSTSETSSILVLDLKKNPYSFDKNTILEDKLIEAAVSVMHYCLNRWIPTNLIFFSDKMHRYDAKDPLMFSELFSVLSEVKFEGNVDVQDILNVYLENLPKTNILIFTSNLDYGLYNCLHKAKFSGYTVVLIYLSPEEITGSENAEAETILSFLPEIGIEAYKININDDIRHTFGSTRIT